MTNNRQDRAGRTRAGRLPEIIASARNAIRPVAGARRSAVEPTRLAHGPPFW